MPDHSLKARARDRQDDRGDPLHRTGDAQEQGGLLLRLPEELHRLRASRRAASSAAIAATTGWRSAAIGAVLRLAVARVRQRLGRSREDRPVHLVVAGHEQAAARGRASRRSTAAGAARSRPARRPALIPVTEQSTPATACRSASFTYRGWASAATNDQQHNVWRASATYVTGAHSLKVGYQAAYQIQHQTQNATRS